MAGLKQGNIIIPTQMAATSTSFHTSHLQHCKSLLVSLLPLH